MSFAVVNDWLDDDGMFCVPDPLIVFCTNCGFLYGSFQFSIVLFSLGFCFGALFDEWPDDPPDT